jgi:hypothetical protein
MATRVWESAILGAPIDVVWRLIRPLTFAYHPNVRGTEVEEKKLASEVGAVVRVSYKDTTVQRLRVVELSDAGYSVSWDLVESIPPVAVTGATHTVKLRRITDVNGTFIEWTTDFSKDAGQDIIQDQRFKQKDHFTALGAALEVKEVKEEKRAPSKKIIGGLGGVYNPDKAREGVLNIWGELQALQKAANESTSINAPTLVQLCARYKKLPITWQIDWRVADLSPDVAQKIADDVREKLNAAKTRLGDNSLPLPRLFNAA